MVVNPHALECTMPQAPELIDKKISRPGREALRTTATAQPIRLAHHEYAGLETHYERRGLPSNLNLQVTPVSEEFSPTF